LRCSQIAAGDVRRVAFSCFSALPKQTQPTPQSHTHTIHTAPCFTTRSRSLCTFLGARHRLCGGGGLTENCVHLNSPPQGRVHMRHTCMLVIQSLDSRASHSHPPTHPPYIYHTDSVGERKSVFPPACLPARTHAAASSSSSYPSRRLGTKQPDRHTPTTTTPPAAVMSGRVTRSSSAANAAAGGGNNHPTTSSSSASPPPPPPPPGRPGFPSSSPL